MQRQKETILWTASEDVQCLLVRYDETRYQLRLSRPEGTVKADLFPCFKDAIAAAERWRAEPDERRSRDWLRDVTKKESER